MGYIQKSKEWVIFSPYPEFEYITYKASETLKKYYLPPHVSLHRGISKKISYQKITTKTTTVRDMFHEMFALDVTKVKKYES